MRVAQKWLARLLLLVVATIVALKVGDLALGLLRNTQQRHLLRLPVNAHYRHTSTEFDYTFNANSLGFRGPERSYTKFGDVRRIEVIGDSFVAGYGVADDAVFTIKLEQLLKKDAQKPVEVINLGRTGSSTIRELDLYTMIGRRFEPDVVVLAYFLGNDLREIVEEHDQDELWAWHPRGLIRRAAYALCPNLYFELALIKQAAAAQARSQPREENEILTVLRQRCDERGMNFETALAAYRKLPDDVRRKLEEGLLSDHQILPACYDPSSIRRALDPDDTYFDRAWPRTERHLNLLRKATEHDGAKLVLLLIPADMQLNAAAQARAAEIGYEVDPSWLSGDCRTERAVKAWCEKNSVSFLDLTDNFRKSSEPLYFLRDGHFNPAGHERTAALLAALLGDTFGEP